MSKVVNIKKSHLIKAGYKNFNDWSTNPNHIYIGRNMNFYVPGTFQSKWHNPYKSTKHDNCIELYEKYIFDSGLINDIEELDGKVLGCWCKPDNCHGDILLKLLNDKKLNK
jgi:hypothetical protein